jgi:hypothetical protein
MDKVYVILQIPVFEESMWLTPINSLGIKELEDARDERALAQALREIADEIEKGMSFEAFGELKDLKYLPRVGHLP